MEGRKEGCREMKGKKKTRKIGGKLKKERGTYKSYSLSLPFC